MDRSPPAVLLAAATAAAAAAALGLNALALAVLARSRLARSLQTVLYSHLAAAAAATAALALAQLLRPAVPALRLPTPADVARPPPAPSDHNPLAPRDTPSACAELAAAAHLALSLATCSLVAIALHHRTINEFAALAAAFKRRAAAAAHTPHSPVPVPAPEYNPEHHPHGRLQPTPGHSTTVTIPASAAALTPASSSPSSTPSPSRMLLSPQTPSPLAGRGPAYHPSVNHWVAAVWAAAIAKTSLSTAVQTTTVHTVGAPVCALGAVGRTNVAQFLHTLDIFSSLSMAACIVWWYSVTAVAPRADPPSSVSLAVSPGGALGPLPRPHAAVGSAGASSGIRGSMESLAARAAGAGSPSGSLSDGQSLHVRSPSSQTGHGDPWQYANHRAACDTEIDYDHLQAQIANAQSARSAFAISLPGVLLLIVHAVETAFEVRTNRPPRPPWVAFALGPLASVLFALVTIAVFFVLNRRILRALLSLVGGVGMLASALSASPHRRRPPTQLTSPPSKPASAASQAIQQQAPTTALVPPHLQANQASSLAPARPASPCQHPPSFAPFPPHSLAAQPQLYSQAPPTQLHHANHSAPQITHQITSNHSQPAAKHQSGSQWHVAQHGTAPLQRPAPVQHATGPPPSCAVLPAAVHTQIAAPAGQGPRKRGSPAATIQLAP